MLSTTTISTGLMAAANFSPNCFSSAVASDGPTALLAAPSPTHLQILDFEAAREACLVHNGQAGYFRVSSRPPSIRRGSFYMVYYDGIHRTLL